MKLWLVIVKVNVWAVAGVKAVGEVIEGAEGGP